MICEESSVGAASPVHLVEPSAWRYQSCRLTDGLYFGVACAVYALAPESFLAWQFHRSVIHDVSGCNGRSKRVLTSRKLKYVKFCEVSLS